jgi:hypothetical protein
VKVKSCKREVRSGNGITTMDIGVDSRGRRLYSTYQQGVDK